MAINFVHFNLLCKIAVTNGTKLSRDGPWEEEIQMCSNEVDASWGEAIRGPKRWK